MVVPANTRSLCEPNDDRGQRGAEGLRVLAIVPGAYDTSPAQRFRIEQWARHLEREGDSFTFVPFADSRLQEILYTPGKYAVKAAHLLQAWLRRLVLLTSARRYDVVFVAREATLIGPAIVERALRLLGIPFVYDFDDPIWMAYRSPTNGLFSRLKFPGKTASICRCATRVIVGNRLLGEWAQTHARRCDVIPSTIDLEHYPRRNWNSANSPVTLGWTGSHSTLPFLELLRGVFPKLARRRRVRLVVISHTDSLALDGLPREIELVPRRWNAATEATDLHDIDVGLAPFPDSGWTPWRCHGKVLQYMAVGVPCVASRIGILPDYITDGANGFLAASEPEWVERLSALIEDGDLRRTVGDAGRRTIEERYSAEVWAPRLREILRDAALSGHDAQRRKELRSEPFSRV